ncbi:MAG: hypothetical protein JXK07_04225 [Spirochaetes bacterium]|nr:hypothetical protein [Spirochaetota bacterium]MBN2770935.1 hypothetical protein [Spirochaetota bacterium]
MKNIIFLNITVLFFCTLIFFVNLSAKSSSCLGNHDCEFGQECKDGVCVKKPLGSMDKSGKPCNIDADCIGAGKCVKNAFGKGYCSG